MHRLHTLLLTALPGVLAAGAAAAQPAPQGTSPVTVESRRGEPAPAAAPGAPALSALCPSAQNDLPEALASAWHQAGRAGEVTATMTVEGEQVSAVTAEGGHPRQRWAVRWALSALACQADRPGPQTFAVRVRFVDPGPAVSAVAGGPVERVAVLGDSSASAAASAAR